MIRLGILGSTRGTNLTAIVNAIAQKKLAAEIGVVISNKKEAGILERAKSFGLQTEFIDPTGLDRASYDAKVSQILQQYGVEFIVLIGYMRIVSAEFVNEWRNKIINIHPTLLPAFAGLMDLAAHQAVIEAGAKETGCTVHYVTEEVDAGPILLQKRCVVLPDDTAEILKARVQALEGEALIEAIQKL